MSPWESRILSFVDSCSVGGFQTSHDAIVALAAILDDAPPALAAILSKRADNARLAQLLEVDAQLCAAMELVGPTRGILIGCSAIGSSSGLVKIVDDVEEGNFFADDPAIALLGAYARALVAIIAAANADDGPDL
ncbi:hypothetical protein ASS64_09680 [Erythrobacter sp. AP23]|nr:hypothetical protein ASS64_09680 [Erythrobacter sp. AP23]